MTTRTALYRHFDADGQLLYVGISAKPAARLSQHMASSEWADDIQRMELEWLPNKDEAARAESAAIRNEHPIWNVIKAARGYQRHLDRLAAHEREELREPTLSQWMAAKKIKGIQMAEYLGISRSYLSDITSYHRSPGLKTAIAIEDFTMGEVTARGLLAAFQAAQGDDQ